MRDTCLERSPMTDTPDPKPETNPFAFSPQDAAEFMQRLWNPMGVPMPGFPLPGTQANPAAGPAMAFPSPATMFATIDPVQIERKIAELKVVENWLAKSLSMMQMSIKALELQHAALLALQPKAKDSPQSPRK
jgi:hypothetical protein